MRTLTRRRHVCVCGVKILRLLSAVVLSVVLTACDSPERTLDTARRQLTEFKANPNDTTQAAFEASLSKLDRQLTDLEAQGKPVSDLRRQVVALQSDFQAARMARALLDARRAIEGFGSALKEAGKSFTDTLGAGVTNSPTPDR